MSIEIKPSSSLNSPLVTKEPVLTPSKELTKKKADTTKNKSSQVSLTVLQQQGSFVISEPKRSILSRGWTVIKSFLSSISNRFTALYYKIKGSSIPSDIQINPTETPRNSVQSQISSHSSSGLEEIPLKKLSQVQDKKTHQLSATKEENTPTSSVFEKEDKRTEVSSLSDNEKNDQSTFEDLALILPVGQDIKPEVPTAPLLPQAPIAPLLIKATEVKGLLNTGNSCYRNAAYQALVSIHPVIDLMNQPLNEGDLVKIEGEDNEVFLCRFNTVKEIRTVFAIFLNNLTGKEKSDFPLDIIEGNLASLIGHSGLFADWSQVNIYAQQDVGAFLECILREILNYRYSEQYIRSGTLNSKTFIKTTNESSVLMKVPVSEQTGNLQEIINSIYSEKTQSDTWKYDEAHTFNEFKEKIVIQGEPQDFIILQLQRGVKNENSNLGGADINLTPIEIPEGGVIDFSNAYQSSEKKAQYIIKSFVRLDAIDGAGGHYTSYVNRNGMWYYCDDNKIREAAEWEIKQEMQLAVVYMLEKII